MGQQQDDCGTALPLSEAERAERRQAVSNALASQRLEGLEPDAEVIAQLRDYAEGRREIGEIVAEFRGRIVGGQLLPGQGKP